MDIMKIMIDMLGEPDNIESLKEYEKFINENIDNEFKETIQKRKLENETNKN